MSKTSGRGGTQVLLSRSGDVGGMSVEEFMTKYGPAPVPPVVLPLMSVYTVFGLPGPGFYVTPGVKVGDRICGGFAFDTSQSAFPVSANRGILTGHGNWAFGDDVVERVSTQADGVQQVSGDDFSAFTLVIFTQAMS